MFTIDIMFSLLDGAGVIFDTQGTEKLTLSKVGDNFIWNVNGRSVTFPIESGADIHRVSLSSEDYGSNLKVVYNNNLYSESGAATLSSSSTIGDYFYVGGNSTNTPGNVQIYHMASFKKVIELGEIRSWHNVNSAPFIDNFQGVKPVCGIINSAEDHIASTAGTDITEIQSSDLEGPGKKLR